MYSTGQMTWWNTVTAGCASHVRLASRASEAEANQAVTASRGRCEILWNEAKKAFSTQSGLKLKRKYHCGWSNWVLVVNWALPQLHHHRLPPDHTELSRATSVTKPMTINSVFHVRLHVSFIHRINTSPTLDCATLSVNGYILFRLGENYQNTSSESLSDAFKTSDIRIIKALII